jgi:hypothetical protein
MIERRPIGSHVAGSVVVPSVGQPRRTHGGRVRSSAPGAGFEHRVQNSSSPRQQPDDGGGGLDASPTARRDGSRQISLREALSDDQLLGQSLRGKSWRRWRILLIAAMGEALTAEEREVFRELTGRDREPGVRCEELIGIIGRRGGKSLAVSVLAAYIAALVPHRNLVPGETGICLIISPDTKQSAVCLNYLVAVFEGSPILRQLIRAKTADALMLTNNISIEVRSANFRRLRGPTYIACICDEAAFWFNDEISANPDVEILNSVRPGLATSDGLLVMISSPYARKGELFRAFDLHYGKANDPILVARAPSRVMNSSLRQSVVDRAYERDPASAAAEYGAEFRSDIEQFVSLERVRACITPGVVERTYERRQIYYSFLDPSLGAGDSMTLAVAHIDTKRNMFVLDYIAEAKPPFSPEQICEEFSATMRRYHCFAAISDRVGGAWVTEQFAHFGITVEQAAKPKSDLYTDLLSLLNSGRCELLDSDRLVSQLVGLERRVGRSGRGVIDHAPGAHDDVANAVAGAAQVIVSADVAQDWSVAYSTAEPATVAAREKQRRDYRAQRFRSYLHACGMPFGVT